jgi:uncharacterized membrane protein
VPAASPAFAGVPVLRAVAAARPILEDVVMIEIENRTTMRAPLDVIFRLAVQVEQWPCLLAHYRRVTLLAVRPEGRIVEMSAVRPPLPLPVRWRAIQAEDGSVRTVRYRHIGGVTRGMEVEWSMEMAGEIAVVTIVHRFAPPWPWPGPWLARRVVCGFFVHGIAERTLAGLGRAAEQEYAQMRAATGEGENSAGSSAAGARSMIEP